MGLLGLAIQPSPSVLDRWLTLPADFHLLRTTCSYQRLDRPEQVAQADQVVVDHMETEYGTDIGLTSQREPAQATELLDPAEHLFDPSAGIGRFGLALIAGGTAVDDFLVATGEIGCHRFGHIPFAIAGWSGFSGQPPSFTSEAGHRPGLIQSLSTIRAVAAAAASPSPAAL